MSRELPAMVCLARLRPLSSCSPRACPVVVISNALIPLALSSCSCRRSLGNRYSAIVVCGRVRSLKPSPPNGLLRCGAPACVCVFVTDDMYTVKDAHR